jgi:4-azaleucine resistance transporter AzlC
MKDSVTKQAFITSIPVMAGYIVLGMGFGLLLEDAGYGVGWAFLMAVTIYAGTMQYVGVSLLAGAASVLTAALTTFTVQARHLFYSISMIERYKGAGKYKPYMIFGLTDETYSLLSDDNLPCDPEDANRYRFFVTLFNHSYWITGCVLGNLLGAILPFSTRGLEFSMTALFVASLTEQWITMHDHIPAVTGLLSTLLCLVVFGSENFLIPALVLMTLILTLLRKREEAQA